MTKNMVPNIRQKADETHREVKKISD